MGNSEGYAFPGRYPEHFAIGVLRGGERDETCLRSPYPQGVPRSRPGTDAALPPCPVSSQANCRSENRIWLADMFAHKARRNRNFQRTEKGTKKAALMRSFSCPTGACSSRKCSPSQARQNPAVSLPGVAAIRLHHSSLKSAEHGRQSIAPASGLEQAGQKLVPSGKAFCCRMPCDAFSGNSPPNILYLSTATSTLQGLMTAVTSEPSSRRRRLMPSRVIIAVICAPPGSSSTTSPLTKPRVSFLILPVN